jgi:hypothetical protein
MPKGLSLHIGLNFVDPTHYQGWDGQLAACEFDAKDMSALAKKKGFKPTMLIREEATANAVTEALTDAAGQLKVGDMLYVTYSGHGGQVPDKNGDEKDKMDETWVLYDRQLVDDELYTLWSRFAPGVRIFVLSDSCHSGSVTKATLYEHLAAHPLARDFSDDTTVRTRALPENVRDATYSQNKKLYDRIQKSFQSGDKVAVNSSILLISGCQDNQLSSDGARNGLFTQTLLKVWNKGKFKGRYRKFHQDIGLKMPPWQSPNFYRAGVRDARFEAQAPFAI